MAETGGRFRLEIRSPVAGAPAGRCVVRLDALRPATVRDRARTKAERLLADGERLYHEDTLTSVRASLARTREALARFRVLGLPAREAEALLCLGRAHNLLGEGEAAAGFYRQALELFTTLGDEAGVGITLSNLGMLARSNGQPEQALALYRRALALHRRSHNRLDEAQAWNNIGRAAMELGETGDAMAAFAQAIPLARSLGDRVIEGRALSNLGSLEISLGQTAQALDHLRRAVALLESLGDRRTLAVALDRMAQVRALAGHPPAEVLATFQRAVRLQREVGDRNGEAVAVHNLGWYHRRRGEIDQAERTFRETLAHLSGVRRPRQRGRSPSQSGGIDLDLGRLAQAETSFTQARPLCRDRRLGSGGHRLVGPCTRPARGGADGGGTARHRRRFLPIETLRRKPADLGVRLTFFASGNTSIACASIS